MRHIERRHAIPLPLPAAEALLLFTPKGELDWTDDWAPDFIHPADGETQTGMVFRTGAGDETTFWSCTDWAPERGYVRYARVTPASRFGYVEVHCHPAGADACEVAVGYTYTALSESGERTLAALTDTAFAAMIEEWRALILARIIALRR